MASFGSFPTLLHRPHNPCSDPRWLRLVDSRSHDAGLIGWSRDPRWLRLVDFRSHDGALIIRTETFGGFVSLILDRATEPSSSVQKSLVASCREHPTILYYGAQLPVCRFIPSYSRGRDSGQSIRIRRSRTHGQRRQGRSSVGPRRIVAGELRRTVEPKYRRPPAILSSRRR